MIIVDSSIDIVLDAEVMATFDRADYRQSGSSLDSNADIKKKKNAKKKTTLRNTMKQTDEL